MSTRARTASTNGNGNGSAASLDGLRVIVTGTFPDAEDLVNGLDQVDGIAVASWCPDIRDALESLQYALGLEVLLHLTDGDVDGDADSPGLHEELAAVREHTSAPVVLLSSLASPQLIDEALELGVADVLVLPQAPESVAFALHKARRPHRAGPAEHGDQQRGEIVTVFSPKGGTGKTVISTNLSAALAEAGGRVLLVDLDLQFGDAAIMLGVHPEKTLRDLVGSPGDLDGEKLAGYVAKHSPNLDILAAPMRPEDAELVSEDRVTALLEVARGSYDVIVVDTSPFFYGPMLAVLGATDHLLVLCGIDVPTLKNVRLSLETLAMLGFPPEQTSVLLNRVNPKEGLSKDEVEAALECAVAFEVPNDPSVLVAVNRGVPAVLAESASPFAVAVRDVIGTLIGTRKAAEPKRRFRIGGRRA
jgi:pilus assembly protein CpaE